MKSFEKLYKSLDEGQKKLLSYACDEIELRMYKETRKAMLGILKRSFDNGGLEGLKEKLDYMINKPTPTIKER